MTTTHLHAEASVDGFGVQAGDGKVPLRRNKLAPTGREDYEGFGGTRRISAMPQGVQACIHDLVAAGAQLLRGVRARVGHKFDGAPWAGAGAQLQACMPLRADLQPGRAPQRIGEAAGQEQPVPARSYVGARIGPAPRQQEEAEEQAPERSAAARQHCVGEVRRTGGGHDAGGTMRAGGVGGRSVTETTLPL